MVDQRYRANHYAHATHPYACVYVCFGGVRNNVARSPNITKKNGAFCTSVGRRRTKNRTHHTLRYMARRTSVRCARRSRCRVMAVLLRLTATRLLCSVTCRTANAIPGVAHMDDRLRYLDAFMIPPRPPHAPPKPTGPPALPRVLLPDSLPPALPDSHAPPPPRSRYMTPVRVFTAHLIGYLSVFGFGTMLCSVCCTHATPDHRLL